MVLNSQQLGDIGSSAAMAVILTAPLLMLLGLCGMLVRRREHRLHPLTTELR